MVTLRACYSKEGRAKYISHLDLIRCLTRAFARTDIPVWYTEGFNPHIYLTFPLTLALGFTSRVETFDFRLTQDDYPPQKALEELNAALPADIRIGSIGLPEDRADDIAWADYRIALTPAEGVSPEALAEALGSFLARPSIPAEKVSKHRTQQVDLAPMFQVLSLEAGEGKALLSARLAAGNARNLNANFLLDTFAQEAGPLIAFRQIRRVAVRKEDLSLFR